MASLATTTFSVPFHESPQTTANNSSSLSASASSSSSSPVAQCANLSVRFRSFNHSKTHRSSPFNSIHEYLERSWHDLGSLPSAPALLRNHFQFCYGQINLMCPRVQRHRARSRLSFQRLNNRQFLGRIL